MLPVVYSPHHDLRPVPPSYNGCTVVDRNVEGDVWDILLPPYPNNFHLKILQSRSNLTIHVRGVEAACILPPDSSVPVSRVILSHPNTILELFGVGDKWLTRCSRPLETSHT